MNVGLLFDGYRSGARAVVTSVAFDPSHPETIVLDDVAIQFSATLSEIEIGGRRQSLAVAWAQGSMMRGSASVRAFLKLLDEAVPPPEGAHHTLTWAPQDRLGLTIRLRTTEDASITDMTHTFFLDDADFQRPPAETLADVLTELRLLYGALLGAVQQLPVKHLTD